MNCEFGAERAMSDWNKGNARLFADPYIYPATDSLFQEKYKVEYYSTHPLNPKQKCVDEYNTTIFRLLDKEYGKEWRKVIRPFLLPEEWLLFFLSWII